MLLSVHGICFLALSISSTWATFLPSSGNAPHVKESIAPPRGWVKHSVPSPDHNIVLRIGLPQPNFSVLEQHLYEVSDPAHERYGAHLSKEEVEELVAPSPESISAVDAWLASHGIVEEALTRSPAKDWVTLKLPVSLIEQMLNTVSLISLAPQMQTKEHGRPMMYGSTSKAVTIWSGPPATAFR